MRHVTYPGRGPAALAVLLAVAGAAEARAELELEAPAVGGRPTLGIMVADLTEEATEEAGVDAGALVRQVLPGSPAAKAKIRAGDVIVAFGDRRVETPRDVVEAVAASEVGRRVEVVLFRGGKRRTVGVEPAARTLMGVPHPEETPGGDGEAEEAYLGVAAAHLPEEMKAISGADAGVLVNEVISESPAARAGLLPGDVITVLDGEDVTEPGDFSRRIRARRPGETVSITYYRMGERGRTKVKLGRRASVEEALPEEDWGLPEELRRQIPELREYLERLGPRIEDWMGRWRRDPGPAPQFEPGEPPEAGEPYGVGKDIGRILERLEQIEARLEQIERRLDRMDRRGNR